VKCIGCGNDSKYKERSTNAGGHCPSCGKPFAFEPKTGDRLTDAAFAAAIEAVSGGSAHLRWGVESLYYEVCRRKFRGIPTTKVFLLGGSAIFVAVAVYALAVVLIRGVPWFLMLIYAIGIVALYRAGFLRKMGKRVGLSAGDFDLLFSRWVSAHGKPEGVIERKPPPVPGRKRAVEPDVADYSFDRAVICDRARTVDLLLANNFHFENNCAVLAVNGYPQGPFETVRAMLRRNPRLRVFVLHDATPTGCRLAHYLANHQDWFKGQVPVTDVGLRPFHAAPFAGLFIAPEVTSVAPGTGVSAEEAAWLASDNLELAVIRPEQVLKRLYRAVNVDLEALIAENGPPVEGVIVDRRSFAATASASDAGTSSGADGFG
jgi:hypothetical protein